MHTRYPPGQKLKIATGVNTSKRGEITIWTGNIKKEKQKQINERN